MKRLAFASLTSWQEFVCHRCQEPHRAPQAPENGICSDCLQLLQRESAERSIQLQEAESQRQACTERLEAWPQTLERFGVPKKYRQVPRDLDVPPSCRDWKGSPWSITILGLTGRCKTWTATRIWGELVCELGDGLWIDTTMAIERIHADIRSGRAVTMDLLLSTAALLLDDLLAERHDLPFVRDKIGFVLRTRYNDQAPTLLTSNALDGDPTSSTFGQPSLIGIDQLDPEGRLASRLTSGLVVKLTGPDRRAPWRSFVG